MRLDRQGAQVEGFCDFAVGASSGDEAEYFELARAELVESLRRDCRYQCQCESVMPCELLKPATTVSDNLRTHLAVAVTAQPKLLRAMFDVGYFLPNTPPDTAGH